MRRVKRWAAGGLCISLGCGGLADDAPRPAPGGPASARAPEQPERRNGARNDRPRPPPPRSPGVAPTPDPAPVASAAPPSSTAPELEPPACAAGGTRCNGRIVEVCVQTGPARPRWESLEVCSCECQTQGGLSSCDDTSCGRICTPGALSCADNALLECAADGLSIAALALCDTACLCELSAQRTDLRRCIRAGCQAGEARCDQFGQLLTCNACQSSFDLTLCAAGEACDAEQGRCAPVAADAGAAAP